MDILNIGVLDKELNLIGVIDEIEAFKVITNLSTPSTFKLNIVLTEESCKILEVDNYIILNTHKNLTEAYIIEYKNIQLTNSGQILLDIQGRNLLSLLDRRVVTWLWDLKENIVSATNKIISQEIISSTDEERNISNLIVNSDEINIMSWFANTQLYSNLLDTVSNFLNSYDLGITILLNLEKKQFEIKLMQGVDRTLKQNSVEPVIFSNSLNNVMSQEFIHSTKDYVNVCYVSGEIGTKNISELVIASVNSSSGIGRYETSVNCSQQNLTEKNYQNSFENYGQIYIKNKDLKKCFTAEFNLESDYKFNTNFKIGDTISAISREWDINEELQITQVTESWSNAGYKLSFELGQNLPTLAKQMRILNNNS